MVTVALLFAAPRAANADVAPWSKGVSAEDQAAAGELFKRGNKFMDEAFWREAVEVYRKALKRWDNPAIRGNLAICLLNLDQPIEGYTHMKKALAYKAAPFSPAAYRNLVSNQRLLRRQIAELHIAATQAGTRILLDGKQLFVGPKSTELIVRPGPHRVEGYRTAHRSRNEVVNLQPGKQHMLAVKLESFADATSYTRRWRSWKTWAAFGGAAALVVTSAALLFQADADRRSYTKAIDDWCMPSGCIPGGGVGETELPVIFTETKDRASLFQTLGIVAGSLGGVALVTGAVMWFYNRPKKHVRETYKRALPVQITVAPRQGGAQLFGQLTF